MNYLAHIYLSNNEPSIQIGNFSADAVKGNKYENYPENIKIGILLHRQIDWFTDTNSIVRHSKRRLDTKYGLYKGIIIDIFYDHFLAKNWKDYSSISLHQFTHNFYVILNKKLELLPENIQFLAPHMIEKDWLANYASFEGIERTLIGMNKRTQEKSQMHLAIHDLKEHYSEFENDFVLFFEKLRTFSANKLEELKILNQKNIY